MLLQKTREISIDGTELEGRKEGRKQGRKNGRQAERRASRPGRTKAGRGLILPCGGYLSHIRRKSHTASEAQTVIARVYNRQALILIVSSPLLRCPIEGSLDPSGPDARPSRVSPISDWSPAAYHYLPTWTEEQPGRWTWRRKKDKGRSRLPLKGAEGEIQDS